VTTWPQLRLVGRSQRPAAPTPFQPSLRKGFIVLRKACETPCHEVSALCEPDSLAALEADVGVEGGGVGADRRPQPYGKVSV